MTEQEVFDTVYAAMGFADNTNVAQIRPFYDDVVDFIQGAGITDKTVLSGKICGLIARGCMDLWDYGSGAGQLSDYFYKRLNQLKSRERNSDSNGTSPSSWQNPDNWITLEEIDTKMAELLDTFHDDDGGEVSE